LEKDRLEVLANNAKTLRGTLSPNENPVAGAIPGFPCVYFDAGRATRVSIKRPASHNTLLSTDCLYQRNCRSASGNFTNLVPARASITEYAKERRCRSRVRDLMLTGPYGNSSSTTNSLKPVTLRHPHFFLGCRIHCASIFATRAKATHSDQANRFSALRSRRTAKSGKQLLRCRKRRDLPSSPTTQHELAPIATQ